MLNLDALPEAHPIFAHCCPNSRANFWPSGGNRPRVRETEPLIRNQVPCYVIFKCGCHVLHRLQHFRRTESFSSQIGRSLSGAPRVSIAIAKRFISSLHLIFIRGKA
jgi:hypothetical protein